ncbi:hypothetical protein [Paractinoplanes hotanensis]|uniref:Uncharacterized protein n=1 Tax=Paractinoplanes hotanensis TaxID=2906497 RepID=A0ABT0Y4J4_9ACTN|nr:hypothetical protein [Actinoplanes hotanensis]MCM4080963.1 hypothetical protein [Actinoplanes hotanensis]
MWRQVWTRRTLTEAPVEGGGSARGGHASLVVREPEAQWWAERSQSATTVAAIRESDQFALARLAALATVDELLVVLGSSRRAAQHTLLHELRHRLPRHGIVALFVRHRHGSLLRDAARVERLLDLGCLPVVITAPGALNNVTAEIASYLRADRVLRTAEVSA